MAAVALAIGWYRVDHAGQFPPALDALVPKYLPSVPPDPMAAGGQPLRYLARDDDSIVYSVGVNGIDDQGNTARGPGVRIVQGKWDSLDGVTTLKPKPAEEQTEQP